MFEKFMSLFRPKEEVEKGIVSADLFSVEEVDKTDQHQKCLDRYGECRLCELENDYLHEILDECELKIDPNKESILLLDDNSGVISFLMDDFNSIKKNGGFDHTKYNVLKLDTKLAAFKLRALLYSNKKLRIKYAILDITLGGTLYSNEGRNITLDGVDSLLDILEVHPDVKYFFYTGNKLNPYIKKNEEIISKFSKKLDGNINDKILFKTSLTREGRQEYISKFFE